MKQACGMLALRLVYRAMYLKAVFFEFLARSWYPTNPVMLYRRTYPVYFMYQLLVQNNTREMVISYQIRSIDEGGVRREGTSTHDNSSCVFLANVVLSPVHVPRQHPERCRNIRRYTGHILGFLSGYGFGSCGGYM